MNIFSASRDRSQFNGFSTDLLARSKPPRAELNLKIMGPPNLSQMMLMTGYFIWSVRITLHLREIAPDHEPTFDTGDLSVQPVILLPSGTFSLISTTLQLLLRVIRRQVCPSALARTPSWCLTSGHGPRSDTSLLCLLQYAISAEQPTNRANSTPRRPLSWA